MSVTTAEANINCLSEITGPPGVSIEFVRKFVVDNEHIKGFAGFTTAEVCSKIIAPATARTLTAYTNAFLGLTDDNDKNWLGSATVLVSHAWQAPFAQLLEVLERHADTNPNAYFWLDIFVNKLNSPPAVSKEHLAAAKDAIKAIGTVMMVMSPWNDPAVLGRGWCLWEAMCVLLQPGTKLVFQLPASQGAELTSGVLQDPTALLQTISDVNCEGAQSVSKPDRAVFQIAFKGNGGADYLNVRIKERLRDWYGQILKEVARPSYTGETKKDALVLSQFGFALEDLGMVGDALLYKERSLEIYIDTVGHNHPNTATGYNNIGSAYESIENYDKAVEYFEKAYQIFEATLGPDHPNTLQCKQNMEYAREGNADSEYEYEEEEEKCKCAVM